MPAGDLETAAIIRGKNSNASCADEVQSQPVRRLAFRRSPDFDAVFTAISRLNRQKYKEHFHGAKNVRD